MSSIFWRRAFLTVYVVSMICVSCFIVLRTFDDGGLVLIDDQGAVMRRRAPSILTSVELEDPCWPRTVITDQDYLFLLSQRLRSIPQVSGSFPGEAPGKLTGRLTYAGGTEEAFTLSNALTIGSRVYYSPEVREELESIRLSLAARLYTLPNLAAFFGPGSQVVLEDGTAAITLSPEAVEQVRLAVEEGAVVEELAEVSETVGDRPPRYTIHVRTEAGIDMLRLLVYANESTQVYDTYATGQPLLLCFGSELVPLCQGLLETGG